MSRRPAARTAGRARPALLGVAVAALVLGILGMHGLAGHGVDGHDMDGREMDLAAMASSIPARSAQASTFAHPGHHDEGPDGSGSMLMLCGAMLAAVGATVLALLAPRSLRPRVWAVLRLPDGVWRPAPVVRGLGAGPPSTWRFSVIRC